MSRCMFEHRTSNITHYIATSPHRHIATLHRHIHHIVTSTHAGMKFKARPATPDDSADITRIYNAGIEDRVGTFETRPRIPEDVQRWFDGRHPIVVVEDEQQRVVAFASTSMYRSRECYDGIADFSVYV